MRLPLLFFVLPIFIFSCKTSSTTNQTLDDKIVAAVGSGYTISKNNSNTFALCTKTDNVSLRYKVVRLSDYKVVIEESISKGSVVWSGDLKIIAETTPGIVRADEPINNSKTIDLSRFILNEN